MIDKLTVCNNNLIDQEVEKEMEIINKRVSKQVETFREMLNLTKQ